MNGSGPRVAAEISFQGPKTRQLVVAERESPNGIRPKVIIEIFSARTALVFIENHACDVHLDIGQLAADSNGLRTGKGIVVENQVDTGCPGGKTGALSLAFFDQGLQAGFYLILFDFDRLPFDFRNDLFFCVYFVSKRHQFVEPQAGDDREREETQGQGGGRHIEEDIVQRGTVRTVSSRASRRSYSSSPGENLKTLK